MKVAALIPARMSSKRLPGKNTKMLDGKPLLFWTIDVALEADVFSQVCISTESEEVSALVRDHYPGSAVRVIHRPVELATDQACLNEVCTHFLKHSPEIDFLSLMMPTYPFRQARRIIDEIIPPLYSRQIDRVTSVRHGNYSTFDYWIRHDQQFDRMYTHAPLWCGAGNGAYLFQKRDYYFLAPHKWPFALGERTLRIQTNYLESVDIDTDEDFSEAEQICRGGLPYPEKLVVLEDDIIELVAPAGADLASFLHFLHLKGIKPNLPVLILRPADPLFTFLRWHECNASKNYITEATNQLIASLPASGHSQDFPIHYIHSPCYRVLRKEQDSNGILEGSIPASQVLLEDDLKKEWSGYVQPLRWDPLHP